MWFDLIKREPNGLDRIFTIQELLIRIAYLADLSFFTHASVESAIFKVGLVNSTFFILLLSNRFVLERFPKRWFRLLHTPLTFHILTRCDPKKKYIKGE